MLIRTYLQSIMMLTASLGACCHGGAHSTCAHGLDLKQLRVSCLSSTSVTPP